jgi:asparagine synthase (glutamine-hydrolysing)
LRRVGDCLHHRGPDYRGYFFDASAGVGIAHTRLSILDLSAAGNQPMRSDDGRIVLAYNGEIYNFAALRRELETGGSRFRSRCDTEVVLRAYERWGRDCVDRFCGMFALAVWDAHSAEWFLARDPMGMKPLYYAVDPPGLKGFFFASELKAFREMPGFIPRLSPLALTSFLEFGYTFDLHQTAYEGVLKMPPGHRLVVRGGRAGDPEPYFTVPPRALSVSDVEPIRARDHLFDTLSTVVEQHLVADVPVGILLSGGLDSSIVAALASRHTRTTTICMGFDGSQLDERPYAASVARHIGSDHHDVLISARDVREGLPEAIGVFDDLFDDWGAITTRLLYLKCRQMGIKVVLVGEGSDEIFGGYDTFRKAPLYRGPQAWRLLKLWHCYGNRRYGRTMGPFANIMRGYLRESGDDWFHAVRLFESRHQLPNNYVMKVDKASMSVSVEARAPYLDRRVAEIACRLPYEVLRKGGMNKAILREMAAERSLLPPATFNRPKVGGAIAMNWMDDDAAFRAFGRDVVLDRSAEWTDRLGLRRAMEDYFDKGVKGYAFPHPLSLFRVLAWRLMQLNLWSRIYLSTPSVVPLTQCAGVPAVEERPAVVAGLVSVIIPVYNRADLVRRAVKSVISQTYRPVEIILVDDGSTDDTPRCLAELARDHADIVRVVQQANGGPGRARETGRLLVRGEFVQYLDSDDELLPDKFASQVAALRARPDCGVAYGPTMTRTLEGTVCTMPRKRTGQQADSMFPAFLMDRWWDTVTPLYRRSVVDAAGPWLPLSSEEDWAYDCQVAAIGVRLAWIPHAVAIYQAHTLGGLSPRGAQPAGLLDRAQAYDSILDSAIHAGVKPSTIERKHFAKAAFLLGRQCGAAGLVEQSREMLALAAKADPENLGHSLRLHVYAALARLFGWDVVGRLVCRFF